MRQAENDDVYFHDCFVDTGIVDTVLDTANSFSIISGRTGSGKSALIRWISETHPHVCQLRPESLSLSFLADSWILKTLTSSDFDLGLFYQQLWRHVLVIELLRYEKSLDNEKNSSIFVAALSALLKDNAAKRRAFDYLTKYGGKFWEDTELRVRHITDNFESEISSEMGSDFAPLKAKVTAGEKLSYQEQQELIVNARKIVSSFQMQELANIIDILDEHVFDDKKKKVVLVIDDLDQQWADERIRNKLIEALINVLPKFRRIRNVKILVAMRDDLLDVVLSQATTPGFQREKFEDQRIRISWNKDELSSVINRRVSKLFKSKYTNEQVELKDISTPIVGLQPLMSYVSDRTMMRPRDFLAFFNKLFDKFGGSSMIHQKDVRSIELDFSTERRRALVDEWKSFYPYVDSLIGFLSNRSLSAEFRMGSVEKNIVDDLVLLLHTKFDSHDDSLMEYVKIYFRDNNDTNRFELLRRIFVTLYRVGAIGIKTQANSRVQFSFTNRPNIDGAELNENTPCLVHPMLWQNLSRRGEAKNLFN